MASNAYRLWRRLGLGWLTLAAACGGTTPAPVAPKAEPAKTMKVAKEAKPVKLAEPKIAKPEKAKPEPKPLDLIALSAAAERSVIEAGSGTDLVLRLRLKAGVVPNKQRPAINLALVVDTSGSMEGDAIDNARKACLEVVDKLAPGDQLSIVTFGSRAEVLVPSTKLDAESIAKVKAAIGTMKAAGTTAMAAGLNLGLQQVQAKQLPKGINRVVLLGDGVPNDAAPVLSLAQRASSAGVAITSLGLGIEYDETLMNAIAQRSGGTFHFIDEPTKVAAVFDEQVSRLERVVARNGWLELVPGPGVKLHRAIGLHSQPNGHGLRIQLADLSENQTRDVMIHASLGAHRDGARVELLDATFRYRDPLLNAKPREVRQYVSLTASSDKEALAEGRDKQIEHAATRFRVADLIVRAIATARGGDAREAHSLLRRAEVMARKGAKRFDDDTLLAKAKEAAKLKLTVASLVPRPVFEPSWGHAGGGRGRPHSLPMHDSFPAPKPMTPSQALSVRRAHGKAMDTINGL